MKQDRFFNILWVQLLLFTSFSLLLFFPVINNSFLSDDFVVMKRVGLDKQIWIKGFFRPLSDITLYLNYVLGGFNPRGYYFFNIVLHGVNSFLLLRFCLQWRWTQNLYNQQLFACLASLLFLTYPFHNESIVWVVGRASLLGNFFGFAAMLLLVGDIPEKRKILGVCLCYFTGLASYESIMLLPVLVIILLYDKGYPISRYGCWILSLGTTLSVHFLARILISGGILGAYGSGFFGEKVFRYGLQFFKTTGRLFLPPMQDSATFLGGIVLLMLLLFLIFGYFLKQKRAETGLSISLFKLITALAVCCIVPVIIGVSTKTSESDRFLYFPSFFLCAIISFLFVTLLNRRIYLVISSMLLISYNVFYLEKNNKNWISASGIARRVLNASMAKNSAGKVFLVNIPDESDGAYIFRQGLKEALIMNGMDTSQVVIVNHLSRDQMRIMPDSIIPLSKDVEIIIPPTVVVRNAGTTANVVSTVNGWIYLVPGPFDIVLYWNKQSMLRL